MRFAFKTSPQNTTWAEMLAVWQAADDVGGTPEEFARKRDVLAAHCADLGRDPAALGAERLDLAISYLPQPYDPAVLEPLAEAIRDSGLRDG